MKEIKTLIFCPICNQRHKKEDIKLVNENKDSALVHIYCRKCKNSSLAVFSKEAPERIASMGIMTDLNYKEACQISQREPISSDDVLSVYESLKKQ